MESCPWLRSIGEELHATDVVSNELLAEGIATHDTDDLPEDIVTVMGELMNRPLDTSNPDDRETALRFLIGTAYEGLQEAIDSLRSRAKHIANSCEGNGPLKARVHTERGRMIINICRSDIARAHVTHPHAIKASLYLED